MWDWNGTLLDDFELTARVASRTFERLGVTGVSSEEIRSAFRRPFSDFYARIFGRPLTMEEYAFVRRHYELDYGAEIQALRLQPDAEAAMDLIAAAAATQSLLSMAHDEQLQTLVDRHRIRARFIRVEGSPTTDSDGSKAQRLARHLALMEVDPRRTVLIGDAVDDHETAVACSARSVLVTTGSTSRDSLEATGAPVVDTLLEAARLALR